MEQQEITRRAQEITESKMAILKDYGYSQRRARAIIEDACLQMISNPERELSWDECADLEGRFDEICAAHNLSFDEEVRVEVLDDFIDQYRFGVDEPVIRDFYTGMIYGLC